MEALEQLKELGELIAGTFRGNPANNYLWISGGNTGKKESCNKSRS